MDLLSHFLAIQKVRFGDDLRVVIDIPNELRSKLVPSLLLQPLVENAIRHGITPRAGGGTVLISARRRDGHFLLSVSDDGVGLPPGWSREDQVGLGLALTSQRIAGLYPDTKSNMKIGPREGGGTEVVVQLPTVGEQNEVTA
jgi:LytS/YehU family sensor histidine kinase